MTRAPDPRILLPDPPNELDRRFRKREKHRPDYSEKHVRAGLEMHVRGQTSSEQILSRAGLSKSQMEKILAPAYLPGQVPARVRLPELLKEEREAERRRACA